MVVNESLTAIGIAGVLLGVGLSTYKGYVNQKPVPPATDVPPYSIKKLAGSLLLGFIAATGSLNIVNWIAGLNADLPTLGYIGIFIGNAALGYAIDQAHSASKN